MAMASAHSCVDGWRWSWWWRWEGWQARPAVAVRTVAGPCLLEQGATAQGVAPPEKLSTAVKVRWMGEAVPGRVVNNRRQRPSSNGLAVGACGRRRDQFRRDASTVAQEALHQQHRIATNSRASHGGVENNHAAVMVWESSALLACLASQVPTWTPPSASRTATASSNCCCCFGVMPPLPRPCTSWMASSTACCARSSCRVRKGQAWAACAQGAACAAVRLSRLCHQTCAVRWHAARPASSHLAVELDDLDGAGLGAGGKCCGSRGWRRSLEAAAWLAPPLRNSHSMLPRSPIAASYGAALHLDRRQRGHGAQERKVSAPVILRQSLRPSHSPYATI